MKCGDCRFWVIDPSEADPMETFSIALPGECHRRSPAPVSEMAHLAAMVLAVRQPGAVFEELESLQENWTERGTAWPVVNGNDFCGEFEKRGYVVGAHSAWDARERARTEEMR